MDFWGCQRGVVVGSGVDVVVCSGVVVVAVVIAVVVFVVVVIYAGILVIHVTSTKKMYSYDLTAAEFVILRSKR